MNELNIRPAGPEDSATIYGFIMKMARYEKLESEVDTTEQALRKSLFEERQAEVVLGELKGRPVGFALFFHNFSTFRGQRGLYLEDIYVDEEYRGRGYGKRLLLHPSSSPPSGAAGGWSGSYWIGTHRRSPSTVRSEPCRWTNGRFSA